MQETHSTANGITLTTVMLVKLMKAILWLVCLSVCCMCVSASLHVCCVSVCCVCMLVSVCMPLCVLYGMFVFRWGFRVSL